MQSLSWDWEQLQTREQGVSESKQLSLEPRRIELKEENDFFYFKWNAAPLVELKIDLCLSVLTNYPLISKSVLSSVQQNEFLKKQILNKIKICSIFFPLRNLENLKVSDNYLLIGFLLTLRFLFNQG